MKQIKTQPVIKGYRVYCIDCKHHTHQSTADHSHKCDADAHATWVHTPIEKKKTGPAGDCMVINKNNDCKEFRRKLIAEWLGTKEEVT